MANKTTRKGAPKPRKQPTGPKPARAGAGRKAAAKAASPRRLRRKEPSRPSGAKRQDSVAKSAVSKRPAAVKASKDQNQKKVGPVKSSAAATRSDGKTKTMSSTGASPRDLARKPEATKASGSKPALPKGRKSLGKGDQSARETLDGATPDKDGYVLFKGRRVRVISTKNIKKRRTPSAAAKAERAREQAAQAEPDKPITTKLSKKELDHYRDLLTLLRSQKLGDLSAKEAEALQSNGGNLSHMPIHMADIGTDAYEQDFTLGLAESDRKLIREIDEALSRIENRTYGMCLLTGKPIPKSRLNAKPWAKYTIEAARMVENGQVA